MVVAEVDAEVGARVGVAGTGVPMEAGCVGVGVGKLVLVGVAVGAVTGAAPMSDASTFREGFPHFCNGLICVFSAISFQLMKPQPSGLEAELPFHSERIVSPLRRGTQLVFPVRREVLKPGFRGAYQRLPAPWTLSPICLIWSKEAG